MKPTVLVTLPLDPAGDALLESRAELVVAPDASDDGIRSAVADVDYLIVRTMLPLDIFERPNRLLGVVRHGSGLDFIPVDAATAHGIPVANVPGANARAVIEYCVGAILRLVRRADAMDRTLRTNGWPAARALSNDATEVFGKTIGIIGLGTIGGELARVCAIGLGMHVLGYDRHRESLPEYIEPAELDDLIARSDVLSLHCPLTAETRHLVNEQRLRAMKPSAFLINASRGPVVDEDALVRALAERWIAGAALDVYEKQPLAPEHPLLRSDNALLTPHAAALTRESSAAMSVGAAQQVLQLMAGERPDHLVNPEIWEAYLQRRGAAAL